MDDDENTGTHEDPPAPPPPPPPPPDTGHSDIVNDLLHRMTGVEAQIAELANRERDTKPGKRPWTHRGIGNRS